MAPKLSVIVVTYNDLPGLERTLASLEPLLGDGSSELEILVIDGGTAGIDSVTLPDTAVLWSEPDKGIYDAMNKGLDRSKGAHVWFLNGGDESLVDAWEELADELTPETMILSAYELAFGSRTEVRKSRQPSYIWHALPTSHQAIFYPGDRARRARYDLSYPVSADYQFTAELMQGQQTPVRVTALPVARFHVGGSSLVHGARVSVDALRVQREILHSRWYRRALSSTLHRISLVRRQLKARRFG